jgi:hypothetical protein
VSQVFDQQFPMLPANNISQTTSCKQHSEEQTSDRYGRIRIQRTLIVKIAHLVHHDTHIALISF